MGTPAKDYTGKQINKWTVLYRIGSKKIYGDTRPIWMCQCECGTLKEISSKQLNMNPIDCGCDRSKQTREDLTGQKFNYLTVIEFSHTNRGSYWICKCECGKQVTATITDLKLNRVTSCGCLTAIRRRKAWDRRIKSELGNVYGELEVIQQLESRGGEIYWLCGCSCGNETEVRGSHLRSGSVKSCGCKTQEYRIEKITTHGMSGTSKYSNYQKRRRKQREAMTGDWDFEKEQFLRNLFQQCVICGITEQEHRVRWNQSLHVDHIKPLKYGNGLALDNAIILCAECNRSKHAKRLEDLPDHMHERILLASDLFQLLWDGIV